MPDLTECALPAGLPDLLLECALPTGLPDLLLDCTLPAGLPDLLDCALPAGLDERLRPLPVNKCRRAIVFNIHCPDITG